VTVAADDRAFLRAILSDPAAPPPRLVYADWLDEQGDVRGEFLRGEVELAGLPPGGLRHAALKARLRELREAIDAGWLALIDRSPVENCHFRFEFRCPKRWEQLRETGDPAIRYCGACHKNVYHCPTVADAQRHVWQSHCVAVDSRTVRTEGDLMPFDPEATAHTTVGVLRPMPEDRGEQASRIRDSILNLGRGLFRRGRRGRS
jgi:uncharacterized protein (TIGR02996 family)